MTKTILTMIGALAALFALSFGAVRDLHCHTSGVCHSHPHSETGHSHDGEAITENYGH